MRLIVAATLLLTTLETGMANEAVIRVDAEKTLNRVSSLLTGACLEDVNHEVYGGLYSQMIFGESFQEPASVPLIQGFTSFGGRWEARDGELFASAGPGPRLASDGESIEDGAVGVEVFFPDAGAGNAGLVLRHSEGSVGADAFHGYEISMDPARQVVVLGRHRGNWEWMREAPCDVPAGRWIGLEGRLKGGAITVLVDGKEVLTHEDTQQPLAPGTVAVRTWEREARFRSLTVTCGGETKSLPFSPASQAEPTGVSGMWRPYVSGTAQPEFATVTNHPFHGRQSQQMSHNGGIGEAGIVNLGLNRRGLHWEAGREYDGYLWARCDKPARLTVKALDAAGNALSTRRVEIKPWCWRRLDFTLAPNRSDSRGSFAIALSSPGTVDLGYAFLQPGSWGRYKGLPVRKDVAEGLKAMGLTVLRYGGSMVNAPEYRWKKMIGPRERRAPYRGFWYPHASNGWGIVDFLDLCEALEATAIPAFNMDETPEDMAHFIEYANGRGDSEWGARRRADGHPLPYGLKHIQLGNEEAVDEEYWRRFQPMAEAMWKKDPAIVIVVGDFLYEKPIQDPMNFDGAPRIRSLAAHRKILELAKEHDRAVWFDVHIWNDRPHDPETALLALRSFSEKLGGLCPGADYRVVVFEENANSHGMARALSHAKVINDVQRIGDAVPVLCCANALQPDGQNDDGWNQGLLFLDPARVWMQPPAYVTRMMAAAKPPLVNRVEAVVEGAGNSLDVTARASADGKTLQLQVVNLDGEPVTARITMEGFEARGPARVIELSGALDAVNSAEAPDAVAPVERDLKPPGKELSHTFPAHSVTLLRLSR